MKTKTFSILLLAAVIAAVPAFRPALAVDMDTLEQYLYPEPAKTVSLNFTNANLENVLKVFSQQSGLNFIVTSDIAADTINIYMEKVPVEEALEKILSANNLTYEISPGSNIFVVKRQETVAQQLMTRVYPLKFATVPSSSLLSTLTDIQAPGAQGSSIMTAVEAVLSDVGKVVEDSRTNSLIIRDLPSQFPLIESTITRLDVRVPQILIEAEMLDISKTTADDMGVKFGDASWIDFSPASRNTAYPFNPDKLLPDGLFTKEYTAGTISFPAFATTIDFLRSHTDTKNLARPKILTLNNTPAEISIVTDQAIGTVTNTTSSEGIGESTQEPERVETGVSLRVTPQANINTGEIVMAIEPSVSDVSRSSISDSIFDPEERGSKSILRVNDGDTVVLGGLLRTEGSDVKTSVPILGQVPIIGMPFRHKDKTEEQRELIIFITPHIVEDDAPFRTALREKQNIAREQTRPSNRALEIEKELMEVEKKYSSPRK